MDFSATYRCPACESRLLKRLLTSQSDTESWFECEVCQHVFDENPFEHEAPGTGGFGRPTVFEIDDRALRTALRAHLSASR